MKLLLALIMSVSPTQADIPKKCFGHDVTIQGTDGRDVRFGTVVADVIHVGPGPDLVVGLEGNDRVCGGKGADDLSGDGGFDRIQGGPGEDRCQGEITRRCERT